MEHKCEAMDKARYGPSVYDVQVYHDDNGPVDAPEWYMAIFTDEGTYFVHDITHCPFCGADLGKVVAIIRDEKGGPVVPQPKQRRRIRIAPPSKVSDWVPGLPNVTEKR
jgi:hypothetical protein